MKKLEKLNMENLLRGFHELMTDSYDEEDAWFDDKSDTWQESEKGDEARERIDNLDNLATEFESVIDDFLTKLDDLRCELEELKE